MQIQPSTKYWLSKPFGASEEIQEINSKITYPITSYKFGIIVNESSFKYVREMEGLKIFRKEDNRGRCIYTLAMVVTQMRAIQSTIIKTNSATTKGFDLEV